MYIDGEYVKGNIYFDKSFKDMFWGRVRNHQEYRADVTYDGKRMRMRSRNIHDCENFLLELKRSHMAEYLKTCDWCGSVFERNSHNSTARYCCPGCKAMAMKKKKELSSGVSFFDAHGRRIKPPKAKHKGG